MFVFGRKTEKVYAQNIVDWATKLGQGICSSFGESYDQAGMESFLGFAFVLTEKIHLTFSRRPLPEYFVKAIPIQIESISRKRLGMEISYARMVVVFDRKRDLLNRDISALLEAHAAGVPQACDAHVTRIARILYQQTFGRVVPHMTDHVEGLSNLFATIIDDAKAFELKR